MDYTIVIISLIIGALGLVAGGLYWSKFKTIIKQMKVILDLIINAIEDDKITREELDLIVKEIKDLFELFKGSKTETLKEKVQKRILEIKSKKKK
jgi:hypothetical protein